MENRNAAPSLNRTARTAGILYLIIIASGIFAFFIVRASLIVPGDAAATADNIVGSEGLFRVSIAADLIMIISDVALALAFYVLLRPVSHALSLLAAFFRLVQATILGINLLNLFMALLLLSGAEYLAAAGAGLLQAQAMTFLVAHGIGYSIGLVFFGVSILILGYLIIRSGYIPKILGILLMIAAAGYLVDSFASFLLPNYDDYAEIFGLVVFAPAIVAELSLALWLLIKGVNTEPTQQNLAHRRSAEVDFA